MSHWRKRQGREKYFQQAKSEGYRARSAYKLIQIQKKFQVIKRGNVVIDLGAAPGSWSQVAVKQVPLAVVEGLRDTVSEDPGGCRS